MFDSEDEPGARRQRAIDHPHQSRKIGHIVEGERAIGEIEGGCGQIQHFQIGNPVSDRGIGRIRKRRPEPTLRG